VPKRRKPRQLRIKIYRGREPPTIPPGELLLEYFTDEEVLGWRAKSEDVQSHHYLWWFELEAQRAINTRTPLSPASAVSNELVGASTTASTLTARVTHHFRHSM
jgi:hypothetical protein